LRQRQHLLSTSGDDEKTARRRMKRQGWGATVATRTTAVLAVVAERLYPGVYMSV
jgi:hypothetical protein